VNLEVDVMAKYAERLLVGHLTEPIQSSTDMQNADTQNADTQNEGVSEHE